MRLLILVLILNERKLLAVPLKVPQDYGNRRFLGYRICSHRVKKGEVLFVRAAVTMTVVVSRWFLLAGCEKGVLVREEVGWEGLHGRVG